MARPPEECSSKPSFVRCAEGVEARSAVEGPRHRLGLHISMIASVDADEVGHVRDAGEAAARSALRFVHRSMPFTAR